MSLAHNHGDRDEGFTLEPSHPSFEVNRAIVDHAIRPGHTVTLLGEVNLTQVDHLRASAISYRKPAYTAFVIKAVAMALRDYPIANRRVCQVGFWPFPGWKLQSFTRRDIAVAIERETLGADGTTYVDVIRDADEAALEKISADLHALAQSHVTPVPSWSEFTAQVARWPGWRTILAIRKSLRSPADWIKQRGGAALVTTASNDGVDAIFGSWTHPLGVSFGIVKDRAVVEDQKVVVRKTFYLSLNYDRRIMTGDQAARFFHRIVEILEHAETEMKPYVLQEAPTTREDFPTVNEALNQF
jgi:hypothetical protein